MYQYFFEGDIVRLAYWRIEYGDGKFLYANTAAAKQEIITTLTERGFAPVAIKIDQTGNEWIDGMCFTDHGTVEAALAAGCKDFMCDGDMEGVVDALTTMNDGMFHVDSNNVWHITVPNVPPFSCYNVMACVTANSVDNQKICVNKGKVIPLMKSAADQVIAYDIKASESKPLAIQINITEDKAYLSAIASDYWPIGEIKTFGYLRPPTETELFCDGTAFDKEEYPELYSLIRDNYSVPAEYVIRNGTSCTHVACGNGLIVLRKTGTITVLNASNFTMRGTCGMSSFISSAYSVTSGPYFAGGKFYVMLTRSGGTTAFMVSDDGLTWTQVLNLTGTGTSYGQHIAYSEEKRLWVTALRYIDDDVNKMSFYKSADGVTFTKVYDVTISAVERNPCICYLKSNDLWLFITPITEDECNVYTAPGDLSAKPALAYTLSSPTLHFIAQGFKNSSMAVLDDCALVRTSEGNICKLTAYEYALIETPDDISVSGQQNCLIYADSIKNALIVTPYGTAAIDAARQSAKYHNINYGNKPYILDAAYDSTACRVIIVDNKSGIYSMDASNTALPMFGTEGYKYIKAK